MATVALPPPTCAWGDSHALPTCTSANYAGRYPRCALWQYASRQPIPCGGLVNAEDCVFYDGANATARPTPASWHVHVFFPNPACTNCSLSFSSERPGFTFDGSMAYRGLMAARLNALSTRITGHPPRAPIDAHRAGADPAYSACEDDYHIVAGAPANYHREACIFEVDAVKRRGPFTDPKTGLGYPNWSFFLPGSVWMPNMVEELITWLRAVRATREDLASCARRPPAASEPIRPDPRSACARRRPTVPRAPCACHVPAHSSRRRLGPSKHGVRGARPHRGGVDYVARLAAPTAR